MKHGVIMLFLACLSVLASDTKTGLVPGPPKEPPAWAALVPYSLDAANSSRDAWDVRLKIVNPKQRGIKIKAMLSSGKTSSETTAAIPAGATRILNISMPLDKTGISLLRYSSRRILDIRVIDADTSETLLADKEECYPGYDRVFRERTVLQSQACYALVGWWDLKNREGVEKRAAQIPASEWPGAANAYAHLAAVWMTTGEYKALSPEAARALDQFVREGGTLIVGGKGRKDSPRPETPGDIILKDEHIFLGRKILLGDLNLFARLMANQASFAKDDAAGKRILRKLPIWGDRLRVRKDRGDLAELTRTASPAQVLATIIVLVVVLAVTGPGVLIFMTRKKRPLAALYVTPVLAAAVSLAAFIAYELLADSGDKAVTHGILCLDQTDGTLSAFTIHSVQPPRFGAVRQRTRDDAQLELIANAYDAIRADADAGVGLHTLTPDNLGMPMHYATRQRGDWAGRLAIAFKDGVCTVENALGAEIAQLVVIGPDGAWHKASAAIPADGRLQLSAGTKKNGREPGAPGDHFLDLLITSSEGSLDYLAAAGLFKPGYYACVLDAPDSGMIPTGVSSVQSRFVILGKY